MSNTELYDGEDSREGRRSRSEGRRVSEARGGSETADSENSKFADNEDSEIVDGEGLVIADSEDSETLDGKNSNTRSGLSDVGKGVSRRFSKAGDSICCSSWRFSIVTKELGEWALRETSEIIPNNGEEFGSSNRKPADSNKRSRLSDASGNASRLFLMTGNAVGCSSLTSSTVADELVAHVLRETSEMESSDGGDSREGKDSRSESRRVSGTRGNFETADDRGSDDDSDFSDTTVLGSGKDSSS